MTSLFGDIVSGIIDIGTSFFGGSSDTYYNPAGAPGTRGEQPDPGVPIARDPNQTTDYGKLFEIGGRILETGLKLGAPLINGAVTKPNETKYPPLPDSVKNDPRVRATLGAYGGGTNAPYTQEQSTFQLAFPGLLQNLLGDAGSVSPADTAPTQSTYKPRVAAQPAGQPAVDTTAPIDTPSTSGLTPTNMSHVDPEIADKRIMPGHAAGRIAQYDDLINEASTKYNIPVDLVKAVMEQESGGVAQIKGPLVHGGQDQAIGLMQVLDKTARQDYKMQNARENLKDPALNIETGVNYLGKLIKQFGDSGGTYERVIRAYNAGPGNEKKGKTQDPSSGAYAANKYYRDVVRRRRFYGAAGSK